MTIISAENEIQFKNKPNQKHYNTKIFITHRIHVVGIHCRVYSHTYTIPPGSTETPENILHTQYSNAHYRKTCNRNSYTKLLYAQRRSWEPIGMQYSILWDTATTYRFPKQVVYVQCLEAPEALTNLRGRWTAIAICLVV